MSGITNTPPEAGARPLRRHLGYLLILGLAAVGAWLYVIRAQSVFACPATKYDADHFLAYCHADHYGDYEHGAFWYGLEPVIADSVAKASVLFLGSSRMQFGFSGAATRDFFHDENAPFYLMGFAYWENHLFEGPLLQKLRSSPRVYVINLDTFFEDKPSAPAAAILHDADAESRYRQKQELQAAHAVVCSRLPLCGDDQAFFRSRSTGQYLLQGGRFRDIPVSYDDEPDEALIRSYVERAKPFIAALGVPQSCVIFTMVPTVGTPSASAAAIAHRLGSELVAPRMDDLLTFDQSHLQPASAERWSHEFFALAGDRIRRCLDADAGDTH